MPEAKPARYRDRSIPAVAERLQQQGIRMTPNQLRRACNKKQVKFEWFNGIRRILPSEEARLLALLGGGSATEAQPEAPMEEHFAERRRLRSLIRQLEAELE
jgi:hypothetical protein